MKFIELAAELAAHDWDESQHPRGQPQNAGEFASGPGGGSNVPPPAPVAKPKGVEFVSPNIREGTKLKQARIGLKGTRHKFIVHAAEEVDKALGLKPEVRPVIGMWADGAENSTMSVMENPPWDTLVASAAMKGWLAKQKQVLIFKEGETDPKHGDEAALGSIDVMGQPAEISQYLEAHGLPFHTLEPMYGQDVDKTDEFRVHVYIPDKDTGKALADAGAHYGSKATVRGGRGAFLGTHQESGSDDSQRADARAVFDGILAGVGDAGINKVWQGLRDRLGLQADSVIADQTDTPQFKAWFGDSKIVDADGQPAVMYHGTMGDFDSFDQSRGNVEGNWGAGIYFTNDPKDLSHNYAGRGPDITNKIDSLADQIQDNEDDFEGDYEDAKREAEKRLAIQHEGAAIPVFLKMDQPFKIGGKDETFLDYDMPYDEETEEYGEPGGKAQELIDAIRDIGQSGEYFSADGVEALAGDLQQHALENDGIQASKLELIASGAKNYGYVENAEGKLVASEILRKALQKIGYDGIIDSRVYQKFPRMGLKPTTAHYIVFDPHQVKSAIGNKGTFNPKSTVITDSQVRADAYNPNEPRVPKGQPGGGQWASGGGAGMGFIKDPKASNDSMTIWRHEDGILKVQNATSAWKWAGKGGDNIEGPDAESLNVFLHDNKEGLQPAGAPLVEDLNKMGFKQEGIYGYTHSFTKDDHSFDVNAKSGEWTWRHANGSEKKGVGEASMLNLARNYFPEADPLFEKLPTAKPEDIVPPGETADLMAKLGFKVDEATAAKTYRYYDHPSTGQLMVRSNGNWEWTPAEGKEEQGDKSNFMEFLKSHEGSLTPKAGPVVDALTALGFQNKGSLGGWTNYALGGDTSNHLVHVKDMTGEWRWKSPGSTEAVHGDGAHDLLDDLSNTSRFKDRAKELLDALPPPEPEQPTVWAPHPEATDVGGSDWNTKLAEKLENEFVAVAPQLDAIAAEAFRHPDPKASGLAGVGEDPDEEAEEEEEDEDESFTPTSWEELSSDQQQQVEDHWMDQNLSQQVDSEMENWQDSGQPMQEAKYALADEGTDADYVDESINDLFDTYEEAGTPIPYTKQQIKDAISVETYKSKYDDGKSDPDFTIDPELAGVPSTLAYDPEKQGVLPGFEAPTPSEAFTDDMQTDLKDNLTGHFNDEAEKNASNADAPDYLTDSAKESLGEYWEQMDDDQKWKEADGYLDFDEGKPEKKVSAKPQYGEVTALDHPPKKYDPLNYTTGSNYQRTQAISHKMSIERGVQVLRQRGLIAKEGEGMDQDKLITTVNDELKQMKDAAVSGPGSDWKGIQARMAVASTGLEPSGGALTGWPGAIGHIANALNKAHDNFALAVDKAPGFAEMTPDQKNAAKTAFISKVVAATTLRKQGSAVEGRPNKEYAKTIMEPYEQDAFRVVGDIFSGWVGEEATKYMEREDSKTLGNVKGAVKRVDNDIWRQWVSSSTSPGGKLIQIAAADELGGRLRLPSRPKLEEADVTPVDPKDIIRNVMPRLSSWGADPTGDVPSEADVGRSALSVFSGILNATTSVKVGDGPAKIALAKRIAGVTKAWMDENGDIRVEVGKIGPIPNDAVVPGSEDKGPFLQNLYQRIVDEKREDIEKNVRTRISNAARGETELLREKSTRDAKAKYGGYVEVPTTPENLLAGVRPESQRQMASDVGQFLDHDESWKAVKDHPSPYAVSTYLAANTKFSLKDGKFHTDLNMSELLKDMPEARKWVEDHRTQIENKLAFAAWTDFTNVQKQKYDAAIAKYTQDSSGAWETKEELIKQADEKYADIGGYAGIKAMMRSKWETTQWLLAKAGVHSLNVFRGISDPRVNLPTTRRKSEPGGIKLPDYTMMRNGAASTALKSSVSNGWGNSNDRVVLRLHVPRTAAISVPSYGQNEHKEREVVLMGTAWVDWDAWKEHAPEFEDVPITHHEEAPAQTNEGVIEPAEFKEAA